MEEVESRSSDSHETKGSMYNILAIAQLKGSFTNCNKYQANVFYGPWMSRYDPKTMKREAMIQPLVVMHDHLNELGS